jgi:hypothetical protein
MDPTRSMWSSDDTRSKNAFATKTHSRLFILSGMHFESRPPPTQSKAFGIARDHSLERLDNQG